jgi:hypothetical protein
VYEVIGEKDVPQLAGRVNKIAVEAGQQLAVAVG